MTASGTGQLCTTLLHPRLRTNLVGGAVGLNEALLVDDGQAVLSDCGRIVTVVAEAAVGKDCVRT